MEWRTRSDFVYGTIVHELAHAAHRELDRSAYNAVVWNAWTGPCTSLNGCNNPGPTGKNRRRLLETWASTVEIDFALQRYQNKYNLTNYDYKRNKYQNQRIDFNLYYTSAGYDMIDNVNQQQTYGIHYPKDRVKGYSIKQLEDALRGARSWEQWRNNIRNRYNNSSEQYLNELFNNWKD